MSATPGQAAYEVGDRVSVTGTVVGTNRRLDWVNIDADGSMFAFNRASTSPAISHIAAQEPHAAPGFPLRSDAETAAMLRADLADAEAQLARWPKCPAGCNCRIGIEDDPDRNECGCDGPCNGGEQPAPELAAAKAKLYETAANNIRLRNGIRELAADLTASAAATRPSRKSQIEDEIAIALRKLLEDE